MRNEDFYNDFQDGEFYNEYRNQLEKLDNEDYCFTDFDLDFQCPCDKLICKCEGVDTIYEAEVLGY